MNGFHHPKVSKFTQAVAMLCSALLMAQPLPALAETAAADSSSHALLNEIWIQGNSVTVRTDKPVPYNVFKVGNPPRLVIELTNTENNWKMKSVSLKTNPLFSRIRSGQFQDDPKIARVVIDLKKTADYETRTDGSRIILTANADGEAETAPEAAAESISGAAAPTPAEVVEAAPPIVEKAPAPAPAATPAPAASAPVVDSKPAPAAKAAPIPQPKTIAAKPAPAAPPAMEEEEAEAAPDQSSVYVSPAVASPRAAPSASQTLPAARAAEPVTVPPASPTTMVQLPAAVAGDNADPTSLFGRQPVTLDFYDIEIRDLFKILGEKAGVNIVYGNEVEGTVSIQLRDVPFKDAVDTVLSLKNLRTVVMGRNIIQVMTANEFDQYKTRAISVTKVFPINYAKASDVNTQLTSILTTLGGKGKTLVDDRTNSIIVTDTPDGIETTTKLIQDLDKPTPQVMIEAKIVQVTLGKTLDLGITWGVAYTDRSGNQQVSIGATKAPTSSEDEANASPGSGAVGLMSRTPLNPIGAGDLEATGTGFNPATGMGLSFGFVKDVVRLNAALSALAQKNKSKLLSNPKVATLNNQSAVIKSEISEPYITTEVSFSQGQSVTAQKVNTSKSGISLTVTPTINADGRITMKILPDVTSSQPTSIGVPKTTSQQANTTVIVKDGETFVIGGLISEVDTDSRSYIPILGSIPLIGHLFKKTGKNRQRAELLVFVTPKIIPF